jgi:hypothetical protein
MSRQIVYEVTQPYHPDGKNLVYAPGVQLPLDADLPEGLAVKEVIADVPDAPVKPPAVKPAGKAGRAA